MIKDEKQVKSRVKSQNSPKIIFIVFQVHTTPKSWWKYTTTLENPHKMSFPLGRIPADAYKKNDPKSPWNLTHNVQGNFSDKKDWANKMLNHTGTIAERCRASFVTLWSWSGSRVWIPIREGWQTKPYCFISTHSNKYLWNKHSYSVQTLLHSTESYYRSHLGRETQLTKPSTQV